MNELDAFSEHLGAMNLNQVDLAVALLWYRDRKQSGVLVNSDELADRLHSLGLSAKINKYRLRTQLSKHKDVVSGAFTGQFRIRPGSRAVLDEKYGGLVSSRRAIASSSVIDKKLFAARRKSWQKMVAQINGCYDYGFYDGSAVLIRRLFESMVIAAFEVHGLAEEIKDSKSGEYMLLEGLSKVLKAQNHFKLTRSFRGGIEPIRKAGNLAAHHPHHIATQSDIDGISQDIRTVVSELLHILDGHKS
ncbi:MAG: hypothetical protein ACX94C_10600 [Phycisphaerales bacterium]